MGGCPPQIVDPISKIAPISDLLSYKGCLYIGPATSNIRRRKEKRKETSVEKWNTSIPHYVWAEI